MKDIEEIIDYSIIKGISTGRMEIVFKNVPDKDVTTMISAIKQICDKTRSGEGCDEKPEPEPRKNDEPVYHYIPLVTLQKEVKKTEQIGTGSKVLQINGKAPAVGIGTVTSELADGRVKVKFFRNFKVLTRNNFKLANEDDIERARIAGLPT